MNFELFSPATPTRLLKTAASLALALAVGLSTSLADETALLVPGSNQDFEVPGEGLGYTLDGAFGSGGFTDYWQVIPNNGSRVDGATITTGGVFANASPYQGSVLAGEDTNAGGTSPVSVTFDPVNVSGLTDLSVNVLLAASNPSPGQSPSIRGFETTDFLEIQVRYNGGAFQRLAIYEEDPSLNGGANSFLSQDIDGDGLGDAGSGTAPTSIEQRFKNFSHALNSATTVQIRIVLKAEATGEYIAIDNFRICGNPAVSDPPVLGGVPATAIDYDEGDPPTRIAPGIIITDLDSTLMSGATVQITSNNRPDEDVLGALDGLGITVLPYDASTGTLTFAGIASRAAYTAVLRTVAYQNTESVNPDNRTRIVTIIVTDDQLNNSNPAMRAINVINTIQSFPIPHTESFDDEAGPGDHYEVVGGFDVDHNDFFRQLPSSSRFRFATPITGVISNGFFGGEDIDQNGLGDGGKVVICLDAFGMGNLSVDVLLAAATSGFELGDGLWVEYQFDGGLWNHLMAFRPVPGGGPLSEDTDGDGMGDGTDLRTTLSNFNRPIPDSGNVLKVRVRALTSSTSEEIAFDELTVNGEAVGNPPVLSKIDPGPIGYTEGDGPVVISPTAVISDTDDSDMQSATVRISGNYVSGEDLLDFTPSGGITGSFEPTTGILTLVGAANLAAYEAALGSVTYQNINTMAPSQNTRTVTFRVNDGVSHSNGQSTQIEVLDLIAIQRTPHCESFETDGLGTRYAANSFNFGPDYFHRALADTGGLTGINADGNFAFVGADTGADGNTAHSIEIIIDTSRAPDLLLDLRLAAVANQFEPADSILVEAESDGGGFVRVTSFRGSGINTSLSEDEDNNGEGDGIIRLGPDYTDHTYSLPLANETRIRITMNTSATTEVAAVDKICVHSSFDIISVALTRGRAPFAEPFEAGVPAGFSLIGSATVDPTGGVDNSGKLSITPALNGQRGVAIIEDLNSGAPIHSFTARFKVRFGDSTCCADGLGNRRPADGMSFSFADDIPDSFFGDPLTGELEEGGEGSGLRVTFDMWDSGVTDGDGPGIGVWYNRALVANVSTAEPNPTGSPLTPIPTDPATGQPLLLYTGEEYANVMIKLDADGTVDVFYKDILVLDNVATGYTPISGGRFAFAARTGGANETHFVDDLSISIGGGAVIMGEGIPGQPYDLEFTDDLTFLNWIYMTTEPADAAGQVIYLDPGPLPPMRYYRMVGRNPGL